MSRSSQLSRVAYGVVSLALFIGPVIGQAPESKPFDPAALTAYGKLNGAAGGITTDVFGESTFHKGADAARRMLPAIRVLGPAKANAPVIDIPFGLLFWNGPGEGLNNLAAQPKLKFLQLNDMTDADIKQFAQLKIPSLQSLTIRGDHLTDAGLASLARADLPGLHSLYVYAGKSTDAGLKELAKIGRLQSLVILGQYADAGLGELASLSELQTLTVAGSRITDDGVKSLLKLKKLRSLDLGLTNISHAGVKSLAELSDLEALRLGGPLINDAMLKELPALKRLKVLHVTGPAPLGITPDGLASIGRLKQLQSLNLDGLGNRFFDEDWPILAQLENLESLNLSATNVTGAAFKNLGNLKKLQTLDLSLTFANDVSIAQLANLPQLKTLKVSMTDVTDAGVRTAEKASPSLKVLR